MGKSDDCLDHPGRTISVFLTTVILTCIYTPPLIWIALSMANQTSVKLSIEDFYIAENQSTNFSNSSQSIIYFNLYLRNSKDHIGAYYAKLNLTFSYYASAGIIPLGNYIIPGFHQGSNKETTRNASVVMTHGMSWQEISKNVSSTSDVVFRVDLASAVRFRDNLSRVKSKKHKIMAWAMVEVDRISGMKIDEKAIRLKHMIKHHVDWWIIFAIVFMTIFMALSFCWGALILMCFDSCGCID